MFQNIVVGKPIIEPWKLFSIDEKDWEDTERAKTLFTETRWLPTLMKEAGIVRSAAEVRRNKPELCVTLNDLDFTEVKWGKKFIFIMVGE